MTITGAIKLKRDIMMRGTVIVVATEGSIVDLVGVCASYTLSRFPSKVVYKVDWIHSVKSLQQLEVFLLQLKVGCIDR